MKKIGFAWIVCLVMTNGLLSCEKETIDHQARFEKSYEAWLQFRKDAANSYAYTVNYGSWTGFGSQTDIIVKDGKVVERHFKMIVPPGQQTNIPEDEREWIENESEINSHHKGASAITLDEVYDLARNTWLKKRSNGESRFEANNNGMISLCGYSEANCADDCFNGIQITHISKL